MAEPAEWRLPAAGKGYSGAREPGCHSRDGSFSRGCVAGKHPDRPAAGLAVRLNPDAALVHELDLLIDHFPAVLLMGIRGAVEVKVLRVDRLFVDELVLLGGEVLHPVVPLRARAEPAQ